MLIKALCLFVLLGLMPFTLGLPWISVIRPRHRYSFAYSSGFFIGLALYEIVALPVVLNYGEFSTIVWVYSVVLVVACALSLWFWWFKKERLEKTKIGKLHWTERIYALAFVVIVSIQIYRGFTYDLTYMSLDDAMYITYSAEAFSGHGMLTVNPYTGVGEYLSSKRALNSWNIYPAYLATTSGFSDTTVAHTIQYIQLIILAYVTYWFVVGEIIKKRDNQLIFMLMVSLFFWFGYHSHYSLTFRLLGPNYQGKAVLAVTLTPLIIVVMIKKVEEQYSRMFSAYLFMLSIAGIALTLWATGTIITIVLIPLLLSLLRKERRWEHLLYVPWSCVIPTLTVGVYFLL